jgi:hypothetical protein
VPSRPANITDLTSPQGVHVLNQAIRELHIRIDQAQKSIPLHRLLKTNALLNFGAIGANSVVERSISLPGVTQAATVKASPQLAVGNVAFMWSEYVSAPGKITVRMLNSSAGALTPNTVNWNFTATL